jgi:integrase
MTKSIDRPTNPRERFRQDMAITRYNAQPVKRALIGSFDGYVVSKMDPTKLVPAHYATRGKVGPSEPMHPLKGRAEINAVKEVIKDHPRNAALFAVGTNTAYRCSDILSWKVGDVRGLKPGDVLRRKEQKTKKYRDVNLNGAVIAAVNRLIESRPDLRDEDPLFCGHGREKLNSKYFGRMVKEWCKAAGLKGVYGTHSLRKTWAYMQRTEFGMSLDRLCLALGHSSPAVTLVYACIQNEELEEMYLNEV